MMSPQISCLRLSKHLSIKNLDQCGDKNVVMHGTVMWGLGTVMRGLGTVMRGLGTVMRGLGTVMRGLGTVMRGLGTVMRGLCSAMTGSLHNSIHPPEMEINPPRMACGCPCGDAIKHHTPSSHTLWNACVSVQLHWLCRWYSLQLGRLHLSPWLPGCWSLGWASHGEAAAIAMVTRVLKSWLGIPWRGCSYRHGYQGVEVLAGHPMERLQLSPWLPGCWSLGWACQIRAGTDEDMWI